MYDNTQKIKSSGNQLLNRMPCGQALGLSWELTGACGFPMLLRLCVQGDAVSCGTDLASLSLHGRVLLSLLLCMYIPCEIQFEQRAP